MNFSLNQIAVYWARGVADGYGDFDWEDPVEIPCRWEGVNEQFVDMAGEVHFSKAKVFLAQDVSVGDYLYLGSLDDLTSASSPSNTKGAFPVRRFDKIPDLACQEFLRRSWL